MTEFALHFNLARNSTFKVAKFKEASKKNEYVEAEFHDAKCKEAYSEYQAAGTRDRVRCASKLDATRWAFYQKWKKDNRVSPKSNGGLIA